MSCNCVLLLALIAFVTAQPTTTGVQSSPSGSGGQGVPGAQCPTFVVFTAPDGCSSCSCSVDARLTDCTRSTCSDPGVGTQLQGLPSRLGEQGAPGGQCPNFVAFTAPDGCSTCLCVVDGRMTFCSRNACPEPGNYTINECVENALYAGSDGCNSCQCNAFRSFSWCTRKICLLSEATRPPPKTPQPPTAPLRPPFPTQRPPPSFASFGVPSHPRAPDDTPFRPFLLWNHAVATPTGNPAPLLRLVSGWLVYVH